jgi:hypothetical protein
MYQMKANNNATNNNKAQSTTHLVSSLHYFLAAIIGDVRPVTAAALTRSSTSDKIKETCLQVADKWYFKSVWYDVQLE